MQTKGVLLALVTLLLAGHNVGVGVGAADPTQVRPADQNTRNSCMYHHEYYHHYPTANCGQ